MPEYFINGATSEPYRLEVYGVDGDPSKGTLKVFNIDNGDSILEREVSLSEGSVYGLGMIDMLKFQLLAEEAIEDYEDAHPESVKVLLAGEGDGASSVNNQGA